METIRMKKQIAFLDSDKELIEKILVCQKEHNVPSFIETVRQLCRTGLSKSVNVKIDVK